MTDGITYGDILSKCIEQMKKVGLLEESFTLSRQEEEKLLIELFKIVDKNSNEREQADALTASILDVKEMRKF